MGATVAGVRGAVAGVSGAVAGVSAAAVGAVAPSRATAGAGAVPRVPPGISSSAAMRASALAGRAAGSLASIDITRAARAGGALGARVLRSGGVCETCASNICGMLVDGGKGSAPAHSSYMMRPSA